MTQIHNGTYLGNNQGTWLERLQARIGKGLCTGPKYAHEVVLKGEDPEWVEVDNLDGTATRVHFEVTCGRTREGVAKLWKIRCSELSQKYQRKTGKRWRIEAVLR